MLSLPLACFDAWFVPAAVLMLGSRDALPPLPALEA